MRIVADEQHRAGRDQIVPCGRPGDRLRQRARRVVQPVPRTGSEMDRWPARVLDHHQAPGRYCALPLREDLDLDRMGTAHVLRKVPRNHRDLPRTSRDPTRRAQLPIGRGRRRPRVERLQPHAGPDRAPACTGRVTICFVGRASVGAPGDSTTATPGFATTSAHNAPHEPAVSVVMRPIESPPWFANRARHRDPPRYPTASTRQDSPNVVVDPLVAIRPMDAPLVFVNHRPPSGPAVM